MRQDKKPIPKWSERCFTVMRKKQMTQTELAKELKVNYSQMNAVMNGKVDNDKMSKLICNYLGVER